MTFPNMSYADEDIMLASLVFGEVLAPIVIERVPVELFSTPECKKIASTAIDFYREYHKPPKESIAFLLEKELDHGESAVFLRNILDDLEKIAATFDEYREYYQDRIDHFVILRQMNDAINAASAAVYSGDIARARQHALDAALAAPIDRDLIDPWHDLVPPAFDPSILPPVLRNYIRERAEATGFDAGGIAWAALAACSSALHGDVCLQMAKHDATFLIRPALWVLLIGEPGSGKSPIIRAAFDPMKRKDLENHKAWQEKHKAWEKEDKNNHPEEPKEPRLWTADTTIEALQKTLQAQDRGIAFLPDEWVSLLAQMDRYASGKNASQGNRAAFLPAYDGGPYRSDRIGRGNAYVSNWIINICGGVQPERLGRFRDLTEDGFLQRHVPILIRKPSAVGREGSGRTIEAYRDLIDDLLSIEPARHPAFDAQREQCVLRLSVEAQEVRERVERELRLYADNDALGSGFRTFCGKLLTLWGKLALILAHVIALSKRYENGRPLPQQAPRVIDEDAAICAERLIFDSVLHHAARTYEWLGSRGDLELARNIAGWLLTKQRSRIVTSDLISGVHACRAEPAKTNNAVNMLVTWDWLRPEGDHPLAKKWEVNPHIYSQFADRAVLERTQREKVRELIQNDAAQRRKKPIPENPAGDSAILDQAGEAKSAEFGQEKPIPENPACAHESDFDLEAFQSKHHMRKQDSQELTEFLASEKAEAGDIPSRILRNPARSEKNADGDVLAEQSGAGSTSPDSDAAARKRRGAELRARFMRNDDKG